MDGFTETRLDESNFGESKAANVVQAFDAFPKTKPSYTQQTSNGGVWTVILAIVSVILTWAELQRWWAGETTHAYAVEQGIGHDLQINLDIVVKMKCADLHVNVQDASGDRILAGSALKKDPTLWSEWATWEKHTLGATKKERINAGDAGEYQEEDVHDYIGASHGNKKFKKTPRVPRRTVADSCRIFGNIEGNKVQGDFHITARGHGYNDFGEHLDHKTFNFSHHVNELSFGPYYPSLTNPLDNTFAVTTGNFHKFQYYVSVVPTIYTTDAKSLRRIDKHAESPSSGEDGLKKHPKRYSRNTVFTNQYAVTEQSHPVSDVAIPGVFVKYDIEPIQLTIAEEWSSVPSLFIRLVNVISGVLVAGGWCYQISEWAGEFYGRRGRRSGGGFGMLHGKFDEKQAM